MSRFCLNFRLGRREKKRYRPLKESSSAQPTIPQRSPSTATKPGLPTVHKSKKALFFEFYGALRKFIWHEINHSFIKIEFRSDNLSAAGVILQYKLTLKGGYLQHITNHYLAITVLLTPRVCHSHIPLHLHEFRFHNNYWKTKK